MSPASPNPFILSGTVTGADFADREAERALIRTALTSKQHFLLVYGPRRMGKTSTLAVVQEELRGEGVPVVMADLWTVSSPADMTHRLLRAVSRELGRTISDVALALIRKLKFEVSLEIDPVTQLLVPKIGASLRDADVGSQRASFAETLDAVEAFGKERKTQIGIILDEFQEIHKFGGENAEAELRGIMQHHKHVHYVLAGSDERLIQAMIGPRRAFYKMLHPVRFGPIDAALFAKWIDTRMRTHGVASTAGAHIVAMAGPRTRDIVHLAYHTYERGRIHDRAEADDVHRAFDEIVESEDAPTRVLWSQLSPLQQNVLRALVRHSDGLTTKERRVQFALGSTGATTKAAQTLVERDILIKSEEGYEYDSPFMRGWVAKYALEDVV